MEGHPKRIPQRDRDREREREIGWAHVRLTQIEATILRIPYEVACGNFSKKLPLAPEWSTRITRGFWATLSTIEGSLWSASTILGVAYTGGSILLSLTLPYQ